MGDNGVFLGRTCLKYEDLRVVGFDGIAIGGVHCDESIAVAFYEPDKFYLLVHDDANDNTYLKLSSTEIGALASEQRITLLSSPMKLMKDGVVFYASQKLFDAAGYDPTFQPAGEIDVEWQKFDANGLMMFASCVPRSIAHTIMDHLAREVTKSFTNMVLQALSNQDIPDIREVSELAEMALDAARGRGVGESAILRYGAALLLTGRYETLLSLFPRIKRRYPFWTKESFLSQARDFLKVLEFSASSNSSSTKARLATPEKEVQILSMAVSAAKNARNHAINKDNLLNAVHTANSMREVVGFFADGDEPSFSDFINPYITKNRAYVENQEVKALYARPIFYYPGVIEARYDNRVTMNIAKMLTLHSKYGAVIWDQDITPELASEYESQFSELNP
jgi:hypothetical protein